MQYQYRFEKVMSIREREKDEALDSYNQSVRRFEEAAGKLYELLKKKEDLEEFQFSKLASGLPVQEIRHYQHFIHSLEKTIEHYQQVVFNARNQMNYYQDKLTEKNIEVKKYEKMKEKDIVRFAESMKLEENRQMDDISIQLYANRGSQVGQ
ncbi:MULTISPECIES: flagellar export protein FliJ [Bacillus]|uniref:Flagellar FliJ protein n=2 Tax=Bacillus infantis TaxID=324767 RepID=U5L7Q2_9BACI|nr:MULTISPECIES: flagellar export protein FliJ [Bacillus]AGX03864.1 flagellar biosynthesis chaperone [Bacillus infantis NRRL B-14911]EAR65721.1 flagellar biosynthesis chaperone [Bacillus sp. NRRL B-14911]MCA1034695.1 flagellar biosynthesis chaperone FliJ [Bacillus infantis]MCP1158056.1 flagellar biosynthesis chaperone FliJ [Bacillus infantis]MDT0159388.1 flagellar export protein FliJ [Bacillus sp. AG4(2022)]